MTERLNITLATVLLATYSYAGNVTAPNSVSIDIGGDIELKFKK